MEVSEYQQLFGYPHSSKYFLLRSTEERNPYIFQILNPELIYVTFPQMDKQLLKYKYKCVNIVNYVNPGRKCRV